MAVTAGFVLISSEITLEATWDPGNGQQHQRSMLTDAQSGLRWGPAKVCLVFSVGSKAYSICIVRLLNSTHPNHLSAKAQARGLISFQRTCLKNKGSERLALPRDLSSVPRHLHAVAGNCNAISGGRDLFWPLWALYSCLPTSP